MFDTWHHNTTDVFVKVCRDTTGTSSIRKVRDKVKYVNMFQMTRNSRDKNLFAQSQSLDKIIVDEFTLKMLLSTHGIFPIHASLFDIRMFQLDLSMKFSVSCMLVRQGRSQLNLVSTPLDAVCIRFCICKTAIYTICWLEFLYAKKFLYAKTNCLFFFGKLGRFKKVKTFTQHLKFTTRHNFITIKKKTFFLTIVIFHNFIVYL